MKLDTRHLAQLSVIVETGSFQRAADRLGQHLGEARGEHLRAVAGQDGDRGDYGEGGDGGDSEISLLDLQMSKDCDNTVLSFC